MVAKLDYEKKEALVVAGDAVKLKDMEASGQREEERSAELFQLRELWLAKSEE